jgi:hypothetical protein
MAADSKTGLKTGDLQRQLAVVFAAQLTTSRSEEKKHFRDA